MGRKYRSLLGKQTTTSAHLRKESVKAECPVCDNSRRDRLIIRRLNYFECRACGTEFNNKTGEIYKRGEL